jgi:hypothetical protein
MEERNEIYRRALDLLDQSGLPYLVGGAYALRAYADVFRDTKDLDLFVLPRDSRAALKIFSQSGFVTVLTASYWLAKASSSDYRVDLIFSSKNGLCVVDDDWFRFSETSRLLERPVRLVPVEEMIWSKAFVMERERFDGADVAHLIRARAETIDWDRLLGRFGDHWPILLVHLILFDYIYPGESPRIPRRVRNELSKRFRKDAQAVEKLCRGPLLAHLQYLPDIQRWGYHDARLDHLTTGEISE